MAIGTNITLINTLNDGIDEISDLYINCTEDPDLETAVLISNNYYHFEGDSHGTVVSNDLSSFMVDGEGLGYNILLSNNGHNIALSNRFFASSSPDNTSTADWYGLLHAIESCSETDTITIDCSNITWTINGESGGGGGTTPDPEPDPSNRIATRRLVNTTPPIPQNFFTSELDRCLRVGEIKFRPNTDKDVDYYRTTASDTAIMRLIKLSDIKFYYKTNTTSLRSNSLFIDFYGSNATMSLCEVSLNKVNHVSGRKDTVSNRIPFGSHQFREDEEYAPSFSVPSNWDNVSFQTLNEGFNFSFNVNTDTSNVRIEVRNSASSTVYTSTDPYWDMSASQYYNTPGTISIRIQMIK